MNIQEKNRLWSHMVFGSATTEEAELIALIASDNKITPTQFQYNSLMRTYIHQTTRTLTKIVYESKLSEQNDVIAGGAPVESSVVEEKKEQIFEEEVPAQTAKPISVNEIRQEMVMSPKIDGMSYELRVGVTKSYCIDRSGKRREVQVKGDYSDSIFLLEAQAARVILLDVYQLRGKKCDTLGFLDRISLLPKELQIMQPMVSEAETKYEGPRPTAYGKKKESRIM